MVNLDQIEKPTARPATSEQDRRWLADVYQEHAPQFTPRAVVAGFLLGGMLSITNLYVGAKTGWSLGVSITAVVTAFVFFKSLERAGVVRPFHSLESNILQTIAGAAGYVNTPLFASMAAYMVITDSVIPWWQMIAWMMGLVLLGVLFAIPFKRHYINDKQMPFPEAQACGVVINTLHHKQGSKSKSLMPAGVLASSGVVAGAALFLQSDRLMSMIGLPKVFQSLMSIPQRLDDWYYRIASESGWWIPSISGITLPELTIRPTLDVAMIGVGGLIGIRVGASLLFGAIINYAILAPWMVGRGDIASTIGADGYVQVGFVAITKWSLWGGVAMMTTASLVSFVRHPALLLRDMRSMFNRTPLRQADCLRSIELPTRLTFVAGPFVCGLVVWMLHEFFGVAIWLAIGVLPLVFLMTIIGIHSTAMTSITPTGALGKITQLGCGAVAPASMTTNVATASVTAEVAFNASNLIQNMKPGYMLGAKPRAQAIGHVIGALAGALFSVAVFYTLFLRNDPAGLITEKYPYPSVTAWRAVAEVMTKGVSELPASALWAMAFCGAAGALIELFNKVSGSKLGLSPVGVGLSFLIPFNICFSMFAGAFLFWVARRFISPSRSLLYGVFVVNHEVMCAGLIAGASLAGVAVMAIETIVQ